jgi:integrase
MAKKRGNNEGSITRRKDGRWMAQVTIGRDPATGKLKRVTLYATTRQEVSGKLTKALHDRQQGTFVAPPKLTLGEWLDSWLREYAKPQVRPITFVSYEMLIRRHFKPALGHIPLQDLRPEHVQHYVNDQLHNGLAPQTLALHHVVLTEALARAEKNGLVARNVGRLVAPPRQRPKEWRTLTVDEVRTQLLPALQEHRLYVAFLTLLMMGLRRGEILGLRWQDIDWQHSTMHIRQTVVRVRDQLVFQEPKTARSRRTLPIPDVCQTALRHHRARQAEERLAYGPGYEDHGLVFCRAEGSPIDPATFNNAFTRVLAQAGLPHVRVHDARHTFATWMLEQGVSPKVVQTLLGHSDIATTLNIYSHVSLDLERRAMDTLDTVLKRGLQ